jgi:hypothetical protein
MRHIVAGSPGLYSVRGSRIGCAPGVLGPRPLRGLWVGAPLRGSPLFGCCIVDTLLHKCHARCAASGSRCCARSPCSPLRGSPSLHRAALLRCSPCPLRGQWVVRRCCGALLPLRGARSVERRCCDARPRCACVRPVSPLLRLAVGLTI